MGIICDFKSWGLLFKSWGLFASNEGLTTSDYPICCPLVRFSRRAMRATGHARMVKRQTTLIRRRARRARPPEHRGAAEPDNPCCMCSVPPWRGSASHAIATLHSTYMVITMRAWPVARSIFDAPLCEEIARRCLACRAQRGPLGVLPKASERSEQQVG